MSFDRYPIKFEQGTSMLYHFKPEESTGKVIFLIHGYFEDGRIFYTHSGKGFAHFLRRNGWDVFVCDLLGKGESVPLTKEGLKHSQFEIITRDIPTYLDKIRSISNIADIHIGAHSWGGVVAIAYLARTKDPHIKSLVSFGAKRRIGLKNLRKLFYIDFAWNFLGNRYVKKYGYLPGAKLKSGDQDEPEDYYRQTNQWVYSKNWISPVDGFDYKNALNYDTPPAYFCTGSGDKILGHIKDVTRLANELGSRETVIELIGKNKGNLQDYNHINILTHRDTVKDHFNNVLQFLENKHTFKA